MVAATNIHHGSYESCGCDVKGSGEGVFSGVRLGERSAVIVGPRAWGYMLREFGFPQLLAVGSLE